MPRKSKPKNTLTAGERAAIYEAEQREKLARMNNDMPSSNKDEALSDIAKKEESSVTQEQKNEAKSRNIRETKKKALPKPQKAIVSVDLSVPVGEVMPLHGMCNGPLSYGSDISELFREIGVPSVRFDGADTPASGYAVDISKIFRNSGADPSDEANYDFDLTDKYLAAARMTGAEIVLRLGESRDYFDPNKAVPRFENLDALARVCINIIRHYNDRWASGFSFDIRHFEIWSRGLSGEGLAEDIDIYRRIANAVKLYDEELAVGGMCFCNTAEIGEFLRFCKKTRTPIDFLTVDCLGDSVEQSLAWLSDVSRMAGNLGFSDLEIVIGKWAYVDLEGADGSAAEMLSKNANLRKKLISDRYSLENAAYSAALLVGIADIRGISSAFAYDAQPVVSPFCGICDRSGERTKQFYALKAFGQLYRAGGRVLCQSESADGFSHSGIYAAAAMDEREGYILIASFDGCGTVDLRIDGIPDNLYTAEIFMLDGVKNMESAASTPLSGTKKRLVLNVSSYGVVLVKLY